jgi:hypothetical protein
MYFSYVHLCSLAQMAFRAVQEYCLPTSSIVLILWLLEKRHENIWWGGGIASHFLSLALDGDSGQLHSPITLTPRLMYGMPSVVVSERAILLKVSDCSALDWSMIPIVLNSIQQRTSFCVFCHVSNVTSSGTMYVASILISLDFVKHWIEIWSSERLILT